MRRLLVIAVVCATAVGLAVAAASVSAQARAAAPRAEHVLLVSVDGLHQSDLTWFVSTHPSSTLAKLMQQGVEYSHAQTPFPSDSFPGMVGIATGGNPKTTGVYYDDTWNRELLPAGTTDCAHGTPGVEVTYFEQLDKNLHALDAGQGLAGLPDGILQMTDNPDSVIDPTQLPVDPTTCTPVYPHQYLKVNTIFEVARAAGLRTAWSDKHPAYEILSGPSGKGVQDYFTPEINSDAPTLGSEIDWTGDHALTMQYDSYKVQAVLNWIDGLNHSGTAQVGTPAIFGMNFQTVSTAEKLPTSNGLAGGYLNDSQTPGLLLQRALEYVDAQLGRMVAAIDARHLENSTVIVISAKHGQSPLNGTQLTRIDDSQIIDALNDAWAAKTGAATKLVAFAIDDDGMLLWLSDRSAAAESFARSFLQSYSGVGNDIDKQPKPFTSSGLVPDEIYAGADAASFIGVPFTDPRVPDVIGVAQVGTVYTGGTKKIAEHGGDNPGDRDVPILVAGGPIKSGGTVSETPVETTQIAPTILQLLGLDPNALQAVQLEHTQILPALG